MTDVMTVVAVIAHALLAGGALLALVRLARGPSLLDRVVNFARRAVASYDTVLVTVHEPARHVEAHPTQAPDTDVHFRSLRSLGLQASGFRHQEIPGARSLTY